MVKQQRSFASRSSSFSRLGLERAVLQADQTGSAADGPDDDSASALSRSSSAGERALGSTQVSKHRSHGTPGPKSPARRPTQRSTPARPLTRDLSGKYGDPAVSQVILKSGSNSADGQNPTPGDSSLGTLSQDRSPRSESICPVERPSSCDTCHYARLAMKGLVQQSPVDRPVYSEHAPVTLGPSTGTRCPVLGARFHRPHRVNRLQ